MWTYLVILISVSAILVVFFRRVIFVAMGNDLIKQEIKEYDEDSDVIANEKKKRISRTDKETLEDIFKRGENMIKAGKDDEAIKCFVQALTINPHHIDSMQKLGVLYMHKQMYSAASALFKDLASLEESSVHYSHLGLALYQQNAFEEALDAYKKAVSLDDTRPQRFVSLCQVYISLKKPELAVIALDKAISLDPQNIEFLFLLADLLFELDEFEKAKDVVRNILELEPENEEALKLLRKRRSS